MKILTKKIFREIRFNKFRSVVIILTVMIAIIMGIGFISIRQSYMATLAAHHENLNNADLRVRLNDYYSVNETEMLSIPSIQEVGINDLEGRIFLYSSVIHNDEVYDGYLIGVNVTRNTINELVVDKGDKQLNELLENQVLVERHFGSGMFGGKGSDINDTLTIEVENSTIDVEIAGFVIDSDYLYPVNEKTDYAVFDGSFCIVYIPLKMLQDFLEVDGINEILVKTNERSHGASQKADNSLSNAIGSDKIQTVIYWDEAPDKEFFEYDNPHDKVGLVFGLFGLIAGATAIYNSLSKLVLAQRTHIGLYGALGAKKRDVLAHYMGFGITLGLVGITIGWIGAALLNSFVVNLRADWHGFTVIKIGIDPVIWIGGSLFALSVIIFFSFLSTLPILRLTPREAMVAPYSKSQLGQEPLVELLMRPLGIFRRLSSKIPLRTVFMNKRRSLSTVIAVATSMIILVASASLFLNIVAGIDDNYTYYEKYDVNVVLKKPTSERAIKNWINQNVTAITAVEGYIYTEVFISKPNSESTRVPLKAFHMNSTLRSYHVIEGKGKDKEELNKDRLLIGSVLARDLSISSGDQLIISFDENNIFQVEVAGITGELYDDALLWTIEGLQQQTTDVQGIGISENVTAFVFDYPDADLSEAEKNQIKRLIENQYHPYAYAESNETLEIIETMMEMIMGFLVVIGLLGLGALVLFTFSSMSLTMMDREMEFLALRAMGAKRRSILKVIFVENLIYGIFGLLIGIPLSATLLRPAYNYVVTETYLPATVPFGVWIVVIGSVIFSVFLATSLLAWKTWRSSLPDMLQSRMVS